MDIETITTLLLVFLYIVFQFAGKSKKTAKKPGTGAPDSVPNRPGAWNELERALDEIRGKLQPVETVEEPAPVNRTENTRLAGTSLEPRTVKTGGATVPGTMRTIAPRLVPEGPVRAERSRNAPIQIERASTPVERSGVERVNATPLSGRLRDPKNARDAFILSEMFGAPLSRRKS